MLVTPFPLKDEAPETNGHAQNMRELKSFSVQNCPVHDGGISRAGGATRN
jgi:hypothetical protein